MPAEIMDVSVADVLRQSDPRLQERAWDELCTRVVWPSIENTLKRKFGFRGGNSRDEDDFNEVLVEAFAAVHSKLAGVRGGMIIGSLQAYSITTAERAFIHFLKRKDPERAKLRAEMALICKADQRMDRWRFRDAMLSGRSKWQNEGPAKTRNATLMLEKPADAAKSCYVHRDPATMLVPDAMLAFFDWIPGPVEFDPLVNFLRAALRRTKTQVEEFDSGNYAEPVDGNARADEAVSIFEILTALWEELAELEPDRRGVFLLFEPPGTEQDPLIDVIIASGHRDLEEIAEFVGLDADKLFDLIKTDRVELKRVAEVYSMEVRRAEGVRKAVTERLARRFEARGLYKPMQRRFREGS